MTVDSLSRSAPNLVSSRYWPILARTATINRPVGPVAFDCVQLSFVRAGSARVFSEFGRPRVCEGDAVLLCPNTLWGSEPDNWITVTTVYIDNDFLVDQVFWNTFTRAALMLAGFKRVRGTRIDLLDRTLAYCAEDYDFVSATYASLDSKSQATFGVSGVFNPLSHENPAETPAGESETRSDGAHQEGLSNGQVWRPSDGVRSALFATPRVERPRTFARKVDAERFVRFEKLPGRWTPRQWDQ